LPVHPFNEPPPGAYGFALEGVAAARALLAAVGAAAPRLALAVALGADGGPEVDRVGEHRAEIRLNTGGWFTLDRLQGSVTFHLDHRPDDGALVHPYLAPAAALAARWHGRDAFHAGAVVARGGDGRAWAVLGEKGAGKSSTLAALAAEGHEVLSDDVLVLDGGEVLAGPRCIDLRAEPARRLAVGESLGVVGARERWRLTLPAALARTPLAGWIVLEWGGAFEARALRGAERLAAVTPHRALRLPPREPSELLRLASLPVWRVRRPAVLDRLEDDAGRIAALLTG
jgi:hypothetical protein